MQSLPNGRDTLNTLSASNMIEYTRAGAGKCATLEEKKIQYTLLDQAKVTASVKTVCTDCIDYIHLAKLDGNWVIVNVLWESNK